MPDCDRSKQGSGVPAFRRPVFWVRTAEQTHRFEPATPQPLSLVVVLTLRSTFTKAAPQLFFTIALAGVKAGGIVPTA